MKKQARISYYTSKREVVYTSLMMCENAPQEWQNVPAENIKRFQKSVRYKGQTTKKLYWRNSNLLFRNSAYGMKF